MHIILFISLIVLIICAIFKPKLLQLARRNQKVIEKIEALTWFTNHWYAGFALFIGNAFIFLSSLLFIFIVSFIPIPFLHVVIFIMSSLISLYFWSIINVSWHGDKLGRLKIGAVGSFFYVFISFHLLFELHNYNLNEVQETFELIGLFINLLISGIAFVLCILYTSFSSNESAE